MSENEGRVAEGERKGRSGYVTAGPATREQGRRGEAGKDDGAGNWKTLVTVRRR